MHFGTKQVLLTGAAGWLGRGLVHALLEGLPDVERLRQPDADLRIRALVLPTDDAVSLEKHAGQVELIRGDIRQATDCSRLCENAEGAILFHTAGIIHPRRLRDFHDINVLGTRNLLEAASAARVRRVVVVSSNSPCGCNPFPDHLFDEESPYQPYMSYGRSKMRMELEVKRRQQEGRLETVVVRPPWFYGPHQPPRQTLFFRMIRDGKMPILGAGQYRRSMAYIDNLAQGLILAAVTPQANGQTYWIADERPYEMREVVDTVERLLETEFGQKCAHKRMRLPGLAGTVAQCMDATLQAVGIYQQKIHVLSEMNKTIACSVAKARRELGYDPKIALEEGMRRSLRWCFQVGQLP